MTSQDRETSDNNDHYNCFTTLFYPRPCSRCPIGGFFNTAITAIRWLWRQTSARTHSCFRLSAERRVPQSLSQCCALPRASILRTGLKWSRVVPALFFGRFVTFWRRFAIHYFNTTYIKLMFALCWLCCIVLGVSLLCSFSKCIQHW